MKLISTLAAVVAVVSVAATSAPSAPLPKLIGTVGPGFTISVKRFGKPLKTLKAGRYTLVVSDRAGIHNFQIEGPGLDRAVTTVPFTGTRTVTLTLRRGTYQYYCVPHEGSMHGSFKVT
jgi:plastocyanin